LRLVRNGSVINGSNSTAVAALSGTLGRPRNCRTASTLLIHGTIFTNCCKSHFPLYLLLPLSAFLLCRRSICWIVGVNGRLVRLPRLRHAGIRMYSTGTRSCDALAKNQGLIHTADGIQSLRVLSRRILSWQAVKSRLGCTTYRGLTTRPRSSMLCNVGCIMSRSTMPWYIIARYIGCWCNIFWRNIS